MVQLPQVPHSARGSGGSGAGGSGAAGADGGGAGTGTVHRKASYSTLELDLGAAAVAGGGAGDRSSTVGSRRRPGNSKRRPADNLPSKDTAAHAAPTAAADVWTDPDADNAWNALEVLLGNGHDAEVLDEATDTIKDSIVAMQRKIMTAHEVIQQLKTVIRAQHSKIEELRDPTMADNAFSPKVQFHLLSQISKHDQSDIEDLSKLQAQVRRLNLQVKELKAGNTNLKRVNRRHGDMLGQCGGVSLEWSQQFSQEISRSIIGCSLTGCDSMVTLPEALIGEDSLRVMAAVPPHLSTMVEALSGGGMAIDSGTLGGDVRAGGDEIAGTAGAAAMKPPWRTLNTKGVDVLQDTSGRTGHTSATASGGPPAATATGGAAGGGGGSPGAGESAAQRVSTAARSAMALWHELEPRGLLRGLLHSAARLSEHDRVLGLTLYVADPWLSSQMGESSASDGAGVVSSNSMKPTTFYLEGKVTVHAFRRDGVRAEAPRFADLASLPVTGAGGVMALPLQAGPGRPVLAALQVTIEQTSEAGQGARSLHRDGLTASQVIGLQLLCNTAAGILDMRRRIESVRAVRGRARECLSIAAEVNGAHNLSEFEARVKVLCTKFFNVANVRICFYDEEKQELITTTIRSHRREENSKSHDQEASSLAAVGRRHLTRFSTKDGIVGRCVRKQAVFHLDRITASPFISETADGVDLNGRHGEINMLAGPMVARFADGTAHIIGVLQLLEKRRRPPDDPLGALERSEPTGGGGASGTWPRKGPEKARASGICDPFTPEDEDFFAELLRILGLAAQRTVQVQQAGGMGAGRGMKGVERLLVV